MNIRPITILGTALAVASTGVAQDPELARTVDELRQRIDELEENQANLLERLGGRAPAQAYTAKALDIGGHETTAFTWMGVGDRQTSGHLATLFELYLKATVDEHWSVFATPGFYIFNGAYLDDPLTPASNDPSLSYVDSTAEGHVILARLQAEYAHSDYLRVRGGIIGSPHGTTSREYFYPAHKFTVSNLHTRAYLENMIYPQQVDGVSLSGAAAIDQVDRFEYDCYAGFSDGGASDPIAGGRLAYVLGDLGLTAAAEFGVGRRPGREGMDLLENIPYLQNPFPAEFSGARQYRFVGITTELHAGDFVNKNEAFVSLEKGYADQKALSTEWTWFALPQLGLSYRFDYYDRGSDLFVVGLTPTITTMALDAGIAVEHAVAVTYDPVPTVRLRLDYHHQLLPNTSGEADFVNFSWSVSF